MNESKLDLLMQLTARPAWKSADYPRNDGERPGFNDHLFQASNSQTVSESPRPHNHRITGSNTSDSGSHGVPPANRTATDDANKNTESIAESCGCVEDTNIETAEATEDAVNTPTKDETADGEHGPQVGGEADDDKNYEHDDAGGDDVAPAVGAAESNTPTAPQIQPEPNLVRDTAALAANGDGPADETVTDAVPSFARPTTGGNKEITLTGDPDTFNYVLVTDAVQPDSSAEGASPDVSHDKLQPRAKQLVAEAEKAAPPSSNPVHRPATAPKRQRPAESEAATTSDRASEASDQLEKQPVDQCQKPQSPDQGDEITDAGRGQANTRAGSRRAEPRAVSELAIAKPSETAVVHRTTPDAAIETAKAEATDDAVRPTTLPTSRSDGLLSPLGKLHTATKTAPASRRVEGQEIPRIDPARFIGRVAKAFHSAHERGGALQLRLSPAELGPLRLELMVKEGLLTASLETETPAARRVLLDHLPALRDRLAEQNIRIERFDVDVRQEGGGQSRSDAQQQRHQHPQQDSQQRNPTRSPAPTRQAPSKATGLSTPAGDSQINLVA